MLNLKNFRLTIPTLPKGSGSFNLWMAVISRNLLPPIVLGIPAQSVECYRQAIKEHRPAFTGKECNCLLSSHFKDQPSIDRSTLSEIASASASERGFSIQGSLLLTIAGAGSWLTLSQPQER
jgi:hypothetical protein